MKKKMITIMTMLFVLLMAYQPLTANAEWRQTAKGNYYFVSGHGKKYRNRWVGDYYVNRKGIMVRNKWIVTKGKKFFVGEDGKYIPKFHKGWYSINNKWYYYTNAGKKKTGFFTVDGKRYYCNENGIMQTGLRKINKKKYYFSGSGAMRYGFRTIKGKRYYFCKSEKAGYAYTGLHTIGGKRYYFDKGGYMQTGWETVENAVYYFQSTGAALVGWQNLSGNTYYFSSRGVMVRGLQKIDDAQYYFGDNGRLQKNTTITLNGKNYVIDSSGCVTEKGSGASGSGAPNVKVSKEMLFFTNYESGGEGYAQTGGDYGNACGKYQFDYRYSLLPLVKYCYEGDPVTFREFGPYAVLTNGNKLQGNQKFYKAWRSIYLKAPETFAAYQDAFAKQEYYDAAEETLARMGINIRLRPDVVKGSVFSYAIQHGSSAAALAVKAAGIKNSTSDTSFIKKLYNYRMLSFPLYRGRYVTEMADALSYL